MPEEDSKSHDPSPEYMQRTRHNAEMSEERVDYLQKWPAYMSTDEARRFIGGWKEWRNRPKVETLNEGDAEGGSKVVKIDGKVYLEYTDWNERMYADQRVWGKRLSEERDAAYSRGLKKGVETMQEGLDQARAEAEAVGIEKGAAIVDKSTNEAHQTGYQEGYTAGLTYGSMMYADQLLAAEKKGSSNGYNLGLKHGKESAWEALGVGPTKEADVAEPHIHAQIDRETPIAGENQYVNPGAELARRQKIGQDGQSDELKEGASIYDLLSQGVAEGHYESDDDTAGLNEEPVDLTDVVEEVATEAVGAESAGIFTPQMVAEAAGMPANVIVGGQLPEWLESIVSEERADSFRKGHLAGSREQDDALEAIKATEEGSVLLDAIAIVQGRRDEYGKAEDSFTTIGGYWSVALTQITGRPVVLSAEDVARMMILLKVARDTEQPKRDNAVDIAGYGAMLQRVRS
jgi:hypothetical protein